MQILLAALLVTMLLVQIVGFYFCYLVMGNNYLGQKRLAEELKEDNDKLRNLNRVFAENEKFRFCKTSFVINANGMRPLPEDWYNQLKWKSE